MVPPHPILSSSRPSLLPISLTTPHTRANSTTPSPPPPENQKGGGAFILARAANGSAEFVNAREPAPAAARADMFAGKPPSASLDGGLAVAVPTELRGLEALWRRHGRLPWARLVRPAAALARGGFAAHVSSGFCGGGAGLFSGLFRRRILLFCSEGPTPQPCPSPDSTRTLSPSLLPAPPVCLCPSLPIQPYLVYSLSGPYNFQRVLKAPALRDAFLIRDPSAPSGWRAPAPGERCCRRPALAAALEAVAARGAGWLYSPEVAETLANEIQAAGGVVTKDDIMGAEAEIVAPLTARLGGLELIFPPPPSSAAVVAFGLKFLAGFADGGGGGGGAAGGGAAAAADDDGGDGGSAAAGRRRLRRQRRRLAAAAKARAVSYGGGGGGGGGNDADADDGGLGLHRLIEAMKHGFAVRAALGDPGGAKGGGGGRRRRSPYADQILAAARDLLDDDFIDTLRAATRDGGVLAPEAYGGRWNPIGKGAPPDGEDLCLSLLACLTSSILSC